MNPLPGVGHPIARRPAGGGRQVCDLAGAANHEPPPHPFQNLTGRGQPPIIQASI